MNKNLKTNECNTVALKIGKHDIKAIANYGETKHYVVNYHKDLKTWRDIFSNKRKSLRALQYRAVNKILSEISKDTGVSKFNVCYNNLDNTDTTDFLKDGDVLIVKKLFKKIELEIINAIKVSEPSFSTINEPRIMDKGSLNTTYTVLNGPIAIDTGKPNTKTVNW